MVFSELLNWILGYWILEGCTHTSFGNSAYTVQIKFYSLVVILTAQVW